MLYLYHHNKIMIHNPNQIMIHHPNPNMIFQPNQIMIHHSNPNMILQPNQVIGYDFPAQPNFKLISKSNLYNLQVKHKKSLINLLV